MLSDEEYVAIGGGRCPRCNSSGITGANIEVDATTCWQNVTCDDCDLEWDDHYELVSFCVIDRGNLWDSGRRLRMPEVKETYPHSLTRDKAVEVAEEAIKKLLDDFEATDPTVVWRDDTLLFTCKSRGFSITGKVLVDDDQLEVTVKLPWTAIAFKGLVKKTMDKRIPKYLEVVDA